MLIAAGITPAPAPRGGRCLQVVCVYVHGQVGSKGAGFGVFLIGGGRVCLVDCGVLGMVGITALSAAGGARRAVPCRGEGPAGESCGCSAQDQYFRGVTVTGGDPASGLEYHLRVFIGLIRAGYGTAKLIPSARFLCLVKPCVALTQQDQSIWSEAAVLH